MNQQHIITELENIMHTECKTFAQAELLKQYFRHLEMEADLNNMRLPRSIIELVRTHIDIQLERNRWK